MWSQRTAEASVGLDQLIEQRSRLLLPAHVTVEFATVLLRLERRGRISRDDAEAVESVVAGLDVEVVAGGRDWHDGLRVARQLNLGESFDSTAYAVARRYGAEFWTCDQRFANAARAAGIQGFRLFA